MTISCFYSLDLTFFCFVTLLCFNFIFSFLTVVLDRITSQRLAGLFGLPNSPSLLHLNFYGTHRSLFLCVIFIQIIVFIFMFWCMGGACEVFPFGSFLNVSVGSIIGVVILNGLLIGFIFSLIYRNLFINTRLSLLVEESIFCLILHNLSFFFFTVGDLVGFFISLEMASFVFFIFAGLYTISPRKSIHIKYGSLNRFAESSLRYLIPSLFSTVLFLLGVFIVYSITGTLLFNEIIIYAKYTTYNNIFAYYSIGYFIGTGLLVISFLFKFAAVPFHSWVFWVYSGSLQSTVFFLSTVAKLFYLMGFARMLYPLLENIYTFSEFFCGIGLLSIIVGTLHGLYERRFAVLIAASGIVNSGYMLLSLSLMSIVGSGLALFNFVVYSYLLMVLFFYTTSFVRIAGGNGNIVTVEDFKIIGFLDIKFLVLFSLIIFSIIGVPPLIGFFPKFFLLTYLFFSFSRGVGIIFLLFVIISAFFYLRWIIYLQTGFVSKPKFLPFLKTSYIYKGKLIFFFWFLSCLSCWSYFLDNISIFIFLGNL